MNVLFFYICMCWAQSNYAQLISTTETSFISSSLGPNTSSTFNLTALLASSNETTENSLGTTGPPSSPSVVSEAPNKVSPATSSSSVHNSCEPINIPMCKGIGYNFTRMPNQLHQDTQEEAGLEVHQFWPLVEIKCSEDLRLFLCSMYVPLCIEDYTGYIPVCRSVCERARKGCEPVMSKYRFSWPDRMNCDLLPVFGGDTLCMDEKLQNGQLSFDEQLSKSLDTNEDEEEDEDDLPKVPKQPNNGLVAGSIFDLFGDKEPDSSELGLVRPTSPPSPRLTTVKYGRKHRKGKFNGNRKHMSTHLMHGQNHYWRPSNFSVASMGSSPFDRLPPLDSACRCECKAPFVRVMTPTLGRLGSMGVRTGGQENCAFPCHSPYFTRGEEQRSHFWITLFSSICAFCTFLTMATFISDPSRFRYPERCIVFLSACYFAVSMGFLIRHYAGHEKIACDSPPGSILPTWTLVRHENSGQIPTQCLLVFWLLYFFGMCASLWWIMLTLTWFLAAALKWSSEAIDSYAQYFHLIAWFTPAVKGILIVSSGAIEGEPFTGVCYVGSLSDTNLLLFVIAPLCIYLVIGCLFLVSGFVSLFRIRSALRQQTRGKTDKLEKLMLRIVIFSILYIVPGVVVIACNVYEWANRDKWATTHNCACDSRTHYMPGSPSLIELDEHRPLVPTGVGITSGFWIWSRKTIRCWARFYGRWCCCGACGDDQSKRRESTSAVRSQHQQQLLHQSSNSVTAALMGGAAGGSQLLGGSSASQLSHARSYKQLMQQQQFQQLQMHAQLQQMQQQQQQQQFATHLALSGLGALTPRTTSNSGSSVSHCKLPLSHV